MKIIILLLVIGSQAIAKLPQLDALLELPAIDIAYELTKDAQLSTKNRPLQYAIATDIKDVSVFGNKNTVGQWDRLKDDTWVWRLMVHAENALSLDFGLSNLYLPPTATLSFYDWSGDLVKGPFTDQQNKPHKQLWPGTIIGDTVTVELRVVDKYKNHVSFSIKDISRGFKSIWKDVNILPKMGQQQFWANTENTNVSIKSGSCNVDVVCDEADGWQDQIRSVARYTISGTGLCTGQMINNSNNDGRPLFLTAEHCGFNSSNDASINVWWNYESSQCRTVGSAASGSPVSISGFNDTQSGSTFRADYAPSDFALLELDDIPNSTYEVFYTGWDRRDTTSSSAVAIHHPRGHAKRISFENDPTSISGWSGSINTHIQVSDWDLGTTEGGSSGSGLWNSDKLLIGQLTGGGAACGNNASDWYGRLYTSWEGGGMANSRLKDWLDPNDSGVQTLFGLGECSAMTVTITHASNSDEVGITQDFSTTISGGTAPYEYQWDINADGETDGTDAIISANYTQKFIDNVTVVITDSNGCTGNGTKAVVIQAPQVNLLNAGTMAQVCGNNDSFIDPGERWKAPVTMQNNGLTDAVNTYAVFTKHAGLANFTATANDNFGNTVGVCNRQFIDISATGTELTWIDVNPSDDFVAEDEGIAVVNLTQPFNLYGQTISSVSLSSNGYISTDPSASGFDWDNDCPLPALPNNTNNGVSTNARIIPMHDDLITQQVFHQHFNTCPRQSELGQNLACDVFMYKGVDLYDATNDTVENFSFEAILYPTVNQWVYQYDGVGFNPASSTIGLQNDNATDGVSFACNTANSINTQQAVCVFHKDNQAEPGGDDSFFHLETPIIAMGDLQVSQQHNGFVEFSVAEDASCDSSLDIKMQAAVYQAGFNQDGSEILSTTLGNNGSCNPVANCSPDSSNDIVATNGLWHNQARSGNGSDMYFSDTGLVYLQYTALPDRSPIWYITGNGSMQNNQAFSQLNKISYNGPFLTSNQTATVIGNSLTTLIDANNAVQTRTINGQFSAELLTFFVFSTATTSQQGTGLWYNPAESGWGASVGTQGDVEVIINYLYDNSGQPYWLLGSGTNSIVEDIDMSYFQAFCPHCPKTTVQSSIAGSIRVDYDSTNTTATIQDMQINIDNNQHQSQWNRTNMPWNLLTTPLDD